MFKKLSLIFLMSHVFILFAFTACQPKPQNSHSLNLENNISKNAVLSSHNNIIGGNPVLGSYRTAQHVVGLYSFGMNSASCTGTLITTEIILTAAHCISDNPKSMYAVFDTSLIQPNRNNIRPVVAAIISPLWKKNINSYNNVGDIALIKFQGSLPSGYYPVSLLRTKYYLVPNALTLLAGFGLQDGVSQTGAGQLRETFTVLSRPNFTQTEALLDQTIGRGTCSGDSGGPAFLLIQGGYYLWGVTSRGDNTCKKTGLYTVVVPYLRWIEQSILQLKLAY